MTDLEEFGRFLAGCPEVDIVAVLRTAVNLSDKQQQVVAKNATCHFGTVRSGRRIYTFLHDGNTAGWLGDLVMVRSKFYGRRFVFASGMRKKVLGIHA